MLSTPRERLRQELCTLGSMPAWTRDLVNGEASAVQALGAGLRAYRDAALGPYWTRVESHVEADQALRARAFLQGGIDAVLNSFRPLLRWTPPVLESDYPEDRDVILGGRGLVLIPSVFCWGKPVTLIDPRLPPVLVYPVARTVDWWRSPGPPPGRDRLVTLLGASRAAVLRTATDSCPAGELARRVALSPPAASHHLRVLREAGLLSATRQGTTILYGLTPLGRDLVAQNPT